MRSAFISLMLCLTAFWVAPLSAQEKLETLATVLAREIENGEHEGVTGGLVTVQGKLVFEAYGSGSRAGKTQDIRSATKSITALLVGALIDQGKVSSVRTKLSDILEAEFSGLPKNDPRRDILIEDLLTMRGGLACNDWAPSSLGHEDKMYKTDDWFDFWVSSPQAYEIGEHFSYCTGGVVALGRVIERLSGKPVPDFANEVLFQPLGIKNPKWDETPRGHTDTGGHLRLSLRGLHKIGQLVAGDGAWEGRQLFSKRWIETMTKVHTPIPERRQKYGYLWWYDEGSVGGVDITLHYAHGNGGNFIFIVPELGVVAAFTGTNYGKPSQFTALQIFASRIVPAIAAETKKTNSGR